MPEEENEINELMEKINNFGKISYNNFKIKIKKCPINFSDDLKYIVTGDKENIITKIGNKNQPIGIICEN